MGAGLKASTRERDPYLCAVPPLVEHEHKSGCICMHEGACNQQCDRKLQARAGNLPCCTYCALCSFYLGSSLDRLLPLSPMHRHRSTLAGLLLSNQQRNE